MTAAGEKDIVVESDLYRVELSNRGGVVRSWQLKKYTDGGNPPRVLDLVNADLAQQTDSWPLSLQLADAQQESAANQGLYVAKASTANGAASTDNTIAAPAQIEFHWSDGQLDVTKTLKFDRDYIMAVETSVQQNGRPVSYSIAWRGGFGDVTAFRAAVQTLVFDDRDGSISTITSKNAGTPNQRNYSGRGAGNVWRRGDRGPLLCRRVPAASGAAARAAYSGDADALHAADHAHARSRTGKRSRRFCRRWPWVRRRRARWTCACTWARRTSTL